MVTILSAIVSIFEFRVRSRASLELELIALRHPVTVLRRQRPGRPRLSSLDRLLWVWLYRIWPQVIDAMVLVKPATVVQWHRKGFRLFWRWRSRRPGRPKIRTEIRDLIRRMSKANPLWGAPRIHGELLKLGIKVSQATVGRRIPRMRYGPLRGATLHIRFLTPYLTLRFIADSLPRLLSISY
jgi:putative transposase